MLFCLQGHLKCKKRNIKELLVNISRIIDDIETVAVFTNHSILSLNLYLMKEGTHLKNKHSIKKTLLTGVIALTAAISVLSGLTNAILLYNSSINHVNSRLNDNVTAYNHSVQNAIATYKTKIEAIAENPTITDPKDTEAGRSSKLSALAQKYGFDSVVISDASGNTTDGTNIKDRDYFNQSISGKTYISSPLVSKATGKMVLIVSAKINSGTSGGIVFARLTSDAFSKMVRDVSIGQSGYGFIVDKNGTIIAHKDQKIVTDSTNYI